MNNSFSLTLHIALLELKLETRDSGLNLSVPLIYSPFISNHIEERLSSQTIRQTLTLQVINDLNKDNKITGKPLCRTDIWELWLNIDDDTYVFVSPRQTPPKIVIIDHDFIQGEVRGDFLASVGKESFYPLSSIDIRIMINWLAYFGDFILHASGISFNGLGYCFIGQSGAGKSTLASELSQDHRVTVLGEDQIILRYLDGQFWIYGTPWHENPARCSPIGAPLSKIFFLQRDKVTENSPLSSVDALTRIMQTAFLPYYLPHKLEEIMERMALLINNIPAEKFSFELGTKVLTRIINP